MRRRLVRPFVNMNALMQALRNDRPLYRDIANLVGPGGKGLINAPAQRTMIDDDPVNRLPRQGGAQPDGISLGGWRAARPCIAWPHSQPSNNDVMGADAEGAALQGDAAPRRSLSGNRQVGRTHDEGRQQIDRPAHTKDHGSRPGGLDGGSQTPRAGIVEIVDKPHHAATATHGKSAKALGAGKGRDVSMRRPHQACKQQRVVYERHDHDIRRTGSP